MIIHVKDTAIELNDEQLDRFNGFTDLQREYVCQKLIGKNNRDAYKLASPETAAQLCDTQIDHRAAMILAGKGVREFIQEMQNIRFATFIMTRDEMASRLSGLARTTITDVLDIHHGADLMDTETGELFPAQTTWALKKFEDMGGVGVQAINELTATSRGLSVKMHSTLQAQKQLAELMGYNKPQQVEVSGALSLNDLYDKFESGDADE